MEHLLASCPASSVDHCLHPEACHLTTQICKAASSPAHCWSCLRPAIVTLKVLKIKVPKWRGHVECKNKHTKTTSALKFEGYFPSHDEPQNATAMSKLARGLFSILKCPFLLGPQHLLFPMLLHGQFLSISLCRS